MLGHVLTFAFLMVIASTALMTPILLYVFDLRHTGWMWQHAALFSAMIAPTDAVSVSSVLKKGVLCFVPLAHRTACCKSSTFTEIASYLQVIESVTLKMVESVTARHAVTVS